MILAISLMATVAPTVSSWMAVTLAAMSLVARAVSWARSLTSLATTANPLPASPARAASMVAFRASRLVWAATLSMTLMTSLIWAEAVPRSMTVVLVFWAMPTAVATI